MTSIHLVHRDSLSCEAIVRQMPNGELLMVCQCKDYPAIKLQRMPFSNSSVATVKQIWWEERYLRFNSLPQKNLIITFRDGRQEITGSSEPVFLF